MHCSPTPKRLRFTEASSRVRFTSAASPGIICIPTIDSRLKVGSLLAQLHAFFPDMEEKEASNNDLDSTIRSLNLLGLSSTSQLQQASAGHGDEQQHTSDLFSGHPDQQQALEAATSSPVQIDGGQ